MTLSAVNLIWLPSALREIRDRQVELQRVAVRGVWDQLDTFVGEKEAALTGVAALLHEAAQSGDPNDVSRVAAHFLKREPSFDEIDLLDVHGSVRFKLARKTAAIGHRPPPLQPGPPPAVTWGPVVRSNPAAPWVALSTPLPGPAARGSVVAVLTLRSLWERTAGFMLGKGGRAYVVDRDGWLIAGDDPALMPQQLSFAERPLVKKLMRHANEAGASLAPDTYVNEAGVPVVATGLPLERTGWGVVVEHPQSLVATAIGHKWWLFIGLSAAGLVVSFAVSHVLSQRFSEPITRLREGVETFGRGQLDHRVRIDTADEIGDLARQFNQMADQLHRSHERLEQSVAEATRDLSALYAVTTPISRASELKAILDDAVARIAEVTQADGAAIHLRGEAAGLALSAHRGLPPTCVAALSRIPREPDGTGQALRQGTPLIEEDLSADATNSPTVLAACGFRSAAYIPLTLPRPLTGLILVASRESGRVNRKQTDLLKAIAHQISIAIENARLYEEAARTLTELERRNTELDSFVYSVSHDLKAPLVTIQGMAGLLVADYGPKLGDEGRHYLERLQANAQHMEQLITDLLVLSRVGREGRSGEAVDVLEVVDECQDRMSEQLAARNAKVTVREGGRLWGIRTQIEQLFANLISNAVKYAGSAPPIVDITVADHGSFLECAVRDNGIGIDPAYHAKIFETFQRLKEVEAEGTGVGLTIVKKIVEGAGGRIWVESTKGQGATFRFTWPKPPATVEVSA